VPVTIPVFQARDAGASGTSVAGILDERILFPCVFLSKGKHHQEFSLRLRAGQKIRSKKADDVKKD